MKSTSHSLFFRSGISLQKLLNISIIFIVLLMITLLGFPIWFWQKRLTEINIQFSSEFEYNIEHGLFDQAHKNSETMLNALGRVFSLYVHDILDVMSAQNKSAADYAMHLLSETNAEKSGSYDFDLLQPDSLGLRMRQKPEDGVERSQIIIYGAEQITESMKSLILKTEPMDDFFRSSYQYGPNLLWSYTILEQQIDRTFPWDFGPETLPPDFDIRSRLYYQAVSPSENPERRSIWVGPYFDLWNGDQVMTHAVPLYDEQDHFLGIQGADVTMEGIYSLIDNFKLGETGRVMIASHDGRIVAIESSLRRLLFDQVDENAILNMKAANVASDALQKIISARNPEHAVFQVDSETYHIQIYPVDGMDWNVILLISEDQVQSLMTIAQDKLTAFLSERQIKLKHERWRLTRNIIFIFTVLLSIALLIAHFLARSVIHPLEKLRHGARLFGEGKVHMRVEETGPEEIASLARIFNQMAHNLQTVHQQLEQKVAQRTQKLNETIHELSGANQVKDNFLAMVSHELRTPLNAVIGFATLLSDEETGVQNPEHKEYLSYMISAAEKLLQEINKILDFTQTQTESQEISLRPVLLDEMLYSVIADVSWRARSSGVNFLLEVDHHIGTVALDAQKAQGIIIQLVSNAIKFTPKGGSVVVKIRKISGIEAKNEWQQYALSYSKTLGEANDFIEIRVIDTGIGIESTQIDRLFHPFEQSEQALSRHYEGTGLGLALVRNFVEIMGGVIGVDSTPHKGSCFMVWLPWQPWQVAKT